MRKHLDKRNTTNREKSAAIPSVADKTVCDSISFLTVTPLYNNVRTKIGHTNMCPVGIHEHLVEVAYYYITGILCTVHGYHD